MNSPEIFYDGFAIRLARDFLKGNPRSEAAIVFASDAVKRASRTSILDLGCGIGWSSFELSRAMPGAVVHGLDLSSQLLAVARQMFEEHESLRYECVDLTRPDWSLSRRQHYDACVMLDVYEHIPSSSRPEFHRALSSVLTHDALVVMTCPTPVHQAFLRSERPDGLQPVDEDVSLSDVQKLAADLSATITHFEYKGIWATNDYFHAAISRSVTRRDLRPPTSSPGLIPARARMTHVEKAADILGREALTQLKSSRRSFFTAAVARARRAKASWQAKGVRA